jgi:predicted RNase H-like nuclease (RuvC/YqgF family)
LTFLDFISQNLISLIALIASIVAIIIARQGIGNRARATAIRKVEGEIIRLEAEIAKLQQGLNRCIRERIELKEEVQALKRKFNNGDQANSN